MDLEWYYDEIYSLCRSVILSFGLSALLCVICLMMSVFAFLELGVKHFIVQRVPFQNRGKLIFVRYESMTSSMIKMNAVNNLL